MERSSPWACPPLNLLNWNLAWTWQVLAWENASSTSLAFAKVAREQEMKLRLGHAYQTAKSNR